VSIYLYTSQTHCNLFMKLHEIKYEQCQYRGLHMALILYTTHFKPPKTDSGKTSFHQQVLLSEDSLLRITNGVSSSHQPKMKALQLFWKFHVLLLLWLLCDPLASVAVFTKDWGFTCYTQLSYEESGADYSYGAGMMLIYPRQSVGRL
jgi:hypothetical protein